MTSQSDFKAQSTNLYNLMKVDIENNMHSIVPMLCYAYYDSNKIKYDRNYAILAKTENGLA